MAELAACEPDGDCERTPMQSFRKRCTVENYIAMYSLPSLVAWLSIICLGATQGLKFLGETRWKLESPPGSASSVADDYIRLHFPQKLSQYAFSQAVLVVAKTPDEASIYSPAVSNLTLLVINATLDSCGSLPAAPLTGVCWWRRPMGLFVGRDRGLDG